MKKLTFKITVAVLTFAIGFLSFGLFRLVENQRLPINFISLLLNTKGQFQTSEDGKIEVIFKGFTQKEGITVAEFEVANRNSQISYYSAYDDVKPLPYFAFNEKADEIGYCGSGLNLYGLNSGNSILIDIPAYSFYQHLDEQGSFQVGFYFAVGSSKFGEVWSEKFSISEPMKQQIMSEAPDWFKHQ